MSWRKTRRDYSLEAFNVIKYLNLLRGGRIVDYTFVAREDEMVEKALDMLFYEGGDREGFISYLRENRIGIFSEEIEGYDPKLSEYVVDGGYIFKNIEEGDLYELAFCILGIFQEAKPLEIIDAIVEKHIECLGIVE